MTQLRLWQHEETGRITVGEERPSERWEAIPMMNEDELPEGISEEAYSWWFENSFVADGVRMGPKIAELEIGKGIKAPWVIGQIGEDGFLIHVVEVSKDCRLEISLGRANEADKS